MSVARRTAVGVLCALTLAIQPRSAAADEGGISFCIPGFFGSLAAAPQKPGWSLTSIYYHTTVDAGPDVAFARQVVRGGLNVPFSGNVRATLDAVANLGFAIPQYVFEQPVLGGQAAMLVIVP